MWARTDDTIMAIFNEMMIDNMSKVFVFLGQDESK